MQFAFAQQTGYESYGKTHFRVRFQSESANKQSRYCLLPRSFKPCFVRGTCWRTHIRISYSIFPSCGHLASTCQLIASKRSIHVVEKKSLNNLLYSKIESNFPVILRKHDAHTFVLLGRLLTFALISVVIWRLLTYIRSFRQVVRHSENLAKPLNGDIDW